MPAWKKNEAGRRGRDAYEGDDFYDAPRREPARNRIERLTRTATALGKNDRYPSEERDEDLDAVADELDRLLADQAEPRRPEVRRPEPHQSAPRRRVPRREPGIDEVMGALDRLDEQVQGLARPDPREDYRQEHRADYRDEPLRPAPKPRPRPGSYAIDNLPADEPYYDEDDAYEAHYAPQPSRQRDRDVRSRSEASMHIYKDLAAASTH